MSSDDTSRTGRKIIEFLIGFAGITAIVAIVALALGFALSPNAAWLAALLWFGGLIYFFATGRRFVAIGMLSALLVPALAAGACFVIVAGMHW